MAITILESHFINEAGTLVERNMHKEINEVISSGTVHDATSIINIEKEVAYLKSRGFDIVYTLKYTPKPTNQVVTKRA